MGSHCVVSMVGDTEREYPQITSVNIPQKKEYQITSVDILGPNASKDHSVNNFCR